jgi:hypothetical protein
VSPYFVICAFFKMLNKSSDANANGAPDYIEISFLTAASMKIGAFWDIESCTLGVVLDLMSI